MNWAHFLWINIDSFFANQAAWLLFQFSKTVWSRLVFDPRSEGTNTMRSSRPIDLQIYDIILNFLIVVIPFFCQMSFVPKMSMNLGEGRSHKSLIKKFKTSEGFLFLDQAIWLHLILIWVLNLTTRITKPVSF